MTPGVHFDEDEDHSQSSQNGRHERARCVSAGMGWVFRPCSGTALFSDVVSMTPPHFDLVSVQHELDNLASARALCGLSESEGLQYHELCDLERALLASR